MKLRLRRLLCLLLCGCRVTQSDRQYTRSSYHQDSVRQQTIRYDSIYIDKAKYVDRTRDTLLIQNKVVEYRYKLLRDTVRIHQIDSIPVIREVEVIKVERHVPTIYKCALAIVIILALSLVSFVAWKIKS